MEGVTTNNRLLQWVWLVIIRMCMAITLWMDSNKYRLLNDPCIITESKLTQVCIMFSLGHWFRFFSPEQGLESSGNQSFFFEITQYNLYIHNACTLTPINTQTLLLWIYLKTESVNPRDWRVPWMTRVENGPLCSALISKFYRLVFVFLEKFGINTKYWMSNSKTGRKRFSLYPDRFRIFHIWSRYPVFTNSGYTIFSAQIQPVSNPTT